jgi:hypothetical protein
MGLFSADSLRSSGVLTKDSSQKAVAFLFTRAVD